jgi:HlyD family secretion protein
MIQMDVAIPRKNRKKQYIAMAIAVILSFTALGIYIASRPSYLNVNRNEILIRKVAKGNFEDFVVFQAQVEPLYSQLINVIEGGAVQEIFVENGDQVTIGTPIARLYNPNTEFNYLAQETGIIEQINQLNVAKLNIRNQELELSKELVLIEHDFNAAKMESDLNSTLYSKKILAKNDYEVTNEKLRYQQERKNIIQKSIEREQQTNTVQIKQINQALDIMEKSLITLRNNKKNFLVLAPASGRLSSFETTLGQNISAGTPIGKIDLRKGYKLSANVDEYYLDKISVGLEGTIQFKGESQKVQVIKVLPEVKNGQFKVELAFENQQLPTLQEGTSFGVKLLFSDTEEKLLLSKGSFNAVTQGKFVFVKTGDKAIKRNIELGRENPNYYEIIAGLKAGEEVIISSYEDYKNIDELKFQN